MSCLFWHWVGKEPDFCHVRDSQAKTTTPNVLHMFTDEDGNSERLMNGPNAAV